MAYTTIVTKMTALQRIGKKKLPYYRVVAIHKSRGPKGKPLEVIGTYDPRAAKAVEKVKLKMTRVDHWISNGAKPTETVASLVKTLKKKTPESK